MDYALCVKDGVRYRADQFEKLPPAELAEKRQYLECIGCKQLAYFRKRSTDGVAACFGARPHGPGCPEIGQEHVTSRLPATEIEDPFDNDMSVIVLDKIFGASSPPVHGNPDVPVEGGSGRGRRYTGKGAARPAEAHRRLSSFLRALIEDPAFTTTHKLIKVDSYTYRVSRYFCAISSLGKDQINQNRGVWGAVTNAQIDDDGNLWLNSGRGSSFSYLVNESVVAALYARFRITDIEDFTGTYVLGTGWVKSAKSEKLYMHIKDIADITLR